MCLAIPMRVVELEDDWATVEQGSVRLRVGTMLLDDLLKIGDYVIVHAGYAIQRLDEEAALETLDLFAQMAELAESES